MTPIEQVLDEGTCGEVTDRAEEACEHGSIARAARRLAAFTPVRDREPLLVFDSTPQFSGVLLVEVRERDVEMVRQVGATEQQWIVSAGSTALGIARAC